MLFVTGEYPPLVGGIGDYTKHLAAALAAEGIQVDVLTTARAWLAADSIPSPTGVQVHANVQSWRLAALPRLLQHVRRLRPDLVHVQYQPAAFDLHGAVHLLPGAIWSILRVPVVVTFHDLRIPYLFPKAGSLRDFANTALARTADAVVTTNDEDRQGILDWGLPRTRVFAIPLGQNLPPIDGTEGIETGDLRTAASEAKQPAGEARLSAPSTLTPTLPPRETGQDEESLTPTRSTQHAARSTPRGLQVPARVGFFGLVNRSKGIETLLAAVAQLRRAGRDVVLDVVGGGAGTADASNNAYLAEVRARIQSLGLGAVVRFVEPPDEAALTTALHCCDVLVLPFDDGASLRRTTLITALAHGLPTVTTTGQSKLALSASGVGPETRFALDDAVASFVPPRDAMALAGTIAGLLDDPERCRQLAEHGVAATQRLRWEAIAAGHRAVYAGVLDRCQRRVGKPFAEP